MKEPAYRHFKPRDKGYAFHRGKKTYFPGKYNSEESLAAYAEYIAALRLKEGAVETGWSFTIDQLAGYYDSYAKDYYGSAKAQRGTYGNVFAALSDLIGAEGGRWKDCEVESFGPVELQAFQDALVDRGLSRSTINSRVGIIKRMFKWGVSKELITALTWQALLSVPQLKRGKTTAKESAPREPVAWADVEAILPELSDVLRAMVWLQWYTGCRSGSLVLAKPDQFCQDPNHANLLLWSPPHKTEHLGKELTLPIGPKCQEKCKRYIQRRKGYCFRPSESAPWKSPKHNDHYTPWTYRRALVRVQEKVIEARTKARDELIEKGNRSGAQATYIPNKWTPHQLRHARGHLVRHRFGVEAAQAILGHDSLRTTEIYSERQLEAAREVALKIG